MMSAIYSKNDLNTDKSVAKFQYLANLNEKYMGIILSTP